MKYRISVSHKLLLSALAFLLIVFGLVLGTRPVEASDLPVSETYEEEASDGCTMLGIQGQYYMDAQAAIDRINAIRLEACQEGVPDPRNSSQSLTEDDYVPIQWSASLEKIARIRAFEGGISRQLLGTGHRRLNSTNIYDWASVSYGGIQTSAEDLAYNSSTDVVYGIDQWYSEKSIWVSGGSGTTGHYTSMINPSYTYIGLGGFYSSDLNYPGTLCAELGTSAGSLGTAALDVTQGQVMQKVDVLDSYVASCSLDGSDTMDPGESQTLVPRVNLSSTGTLKLWSIDDVVYTSSDPSVLSVDNEGNVTAISAGTATIEASIHGTQTASLEITAACSHKNVTFSSEVTDGVITGICDGCGETITANVPTAFTVVWRNKTTSDSSYYYYVPASNPAGSTVQCYFYIITGGDTGYRDMVIESSDPEVLSVPSAISSNTALTVKKAGIVQLSIYPKYNPGIAQTYTLRTGDEGSVDIADAEITLSKDNYIYTGSACKPTVTIRYNDITLASSTDYSVSYQENTNAGTAKVVITGNGIFTGTLEQTFTISPADLTNAAVTLSRSSYECDGTEKEPTVTVKNGTKTLTKDTDYTVSYTDNILPGTATAAIEGMGNYTGSIQKTFAMNHSSHSYDSGTVIQEASCTQQGEIQYTCSICGDIKTEYQEMLVHDWMDVYTVDQPATCTQSGSESIHCKNCSTVKEEREIPATGHSFGDWETVTSPDCTNAGSQRRICSVCSYEETMDVDPNGHDWEEDYTMDLEPTCISDGSQSIHCRNCDATMDSQVIAALGHDWNLTDAEEAACTEDGKNVYICSRCGETKEETIPADGHDWEDDFTVDTEASCGTDGSKSIHCRRCDAKDQVTVIPATDQHTAAETVQENVIDPTDTADGSCENVVYCSDCGTELSRETEVLHAWEEDFTTEKEPTCTVAGSKSVHCKNCDEKKDVTEIPALGHSYGDWETVLEPTYLEKGSHQRKCSVCGNVETEKIAAKEQIPLSSCTVSIADTDMIYNGSAYEPAVTVTFGSETVDADYYKVTYTDNINAGTAAIIVKAAGGDIPYAGSVKKTFEIEKAASPITVTTTSGSFKYEDAQKATQHYSLGAKSKGEGELSYAKVSGDSYLKVSFRGNVYVSKGTPAGTYSAKVTVSSEETANYKAGSLTKTVKLKVGKTATISVATASKSISYSKVKSASQSFSIGASASSKVALTYTKASGNSKLSINASTGKVTVKKGTPKGTYTMKVTIRAAATSKYFAKTITKTIKVKVV